MGAFREDTIAALATPPGVGAVAVVRISGREAVAVARRVLCRLRDDSPPALTPSHRARLARLRDPHSGRFLDEVLALPMLAPRSYTGEDTVEIHCHGGRLTSQLALRALLHAGARGARPGEFTERAFLNGRLDLCQAEAIEALIGASSELGAMFARGQLEGWLSDEIAKLRELVLGARALVEAHLDFPEDDIPPEASWELSKHHRGRRRRRWTHSHRHTAAGASHAMERESS
jgi:tRNA modification GTPase